MTSEDDQTESEIEEAMEASVENLNNSIENSLDIQRPDWVEENFNRKLSGDEVTTLSLSSKSNNTLENVPSSGIREEVEKYALNLSEPVDKIELELDDKQTQIGRITADHIEWEQIN